VHLMIGVTLVIASGLYILHREMRRDRLSRTAKTTPKRG
jgi:hypothetical protein